MVVCTPGIVYTQACDGIDNDMDGLTDEEDVYYVATCNTGIADRAGTITYPVQCDLQVSDIRTVVDVNGEVSIDHNNTGILKLIW